MMAPPISSFPLAMRFGSRATERDCLLYAGMKYLILILVLVSLAAAQNNPGNGAVNNPVTGGGLPTGVANGSVLVSNGVSRPGVYQTKSVIDVRDQGFIGNGSTDNTTAANTLLTAIGSTQTTILFPGGTYVMGSVTFPTNVALDFNKGAILSPSTGHTITIAGPILANPTQIFSNIASGQGALSFSGNRTLTTISPLWFGIDCSGVGDNAPIWNRIVSFTGDDTTFILPQNCTDMHASTVTVSSRAGFRLISMNRSQNGGGNQRPIEQWSGSTGGMWDFQANQAATVEGFLFQNGSSGHLAYFLRFDGNPAARIGTEALIRYNTFANNMVNPGTFDAISISTVSGQNHEKNVITDNDFFCSQSAALRESDSGQITNGSNVLTCGLANCSYSTDATVGDRVRVSYATGILDTTISSITDNNHLVMAANAASTQSNARTTFRQAYGNGITIGSVNAKHNTIDRNSFTQCARGLNVTNGSFSVSHMGGSANDVLAYITNVSEASELAYLEDENSLQDLVTGNSVDSPLTLNHLRNGTSGGGLSNGFIYITNGARIEILNSIAQNTPITNAVLIGAPFPGNVSLTSIGNVWAPGVMTMANLGFSRWRTLDEAGGATSAVLISCGDYGIADAPGGCFQFGEGGTASAEGNIVVNSRHAINSPSFNTFTAEPNVGSTGFVNEAVGFKANILGYNNSTAMKFIGFDAAFTTSVRGGNSVGFRFTMPTIQSGTTAQPFSRGLWVAAPTSNTLITTGTGVYVEDLTTHTGITNRYSFFGLGATDTAHFGGPTELGGSLNFISGKGQHITTQAASNDIVGTLTTSSSTTAGVTFTTNYTATPVCVLTPQTMGLTSWYLSAIGTTGFTVTVAPSGTYTFGYHCLGNPN
jgi:hypothetical protein